jgi:phosphoribosylanthranilate isomerase
LKIRIKICGITTQTQAQAIARSGANSLGFICFPPSPRYISATTIGEIVRNLPSNIDKIGVFVNATAQEISRVVEEGGLTGVQLHGDESLEFCQQLKALLPEIELIKAVRVKNPASLIESYDYADYVDTLLLDAYHPQMLGGTGQTLPWHKLAEFRPKIPWLLAGGLNPDNILEALTLVKPDGVDLSSGVEKSPGDKDLAKVALLCDRLKSI